MKSSVFEYQDYKKYLREVIENRPSHGRGEKSKIARALKCHLTYVSQVLNGKADFSVEQGEALNRHLGHRDEEAEYYLLLIMEARSGTRELKNFLGQRIRKLLEQRQVLKNRLQFDQTLSTENQATYYSAWYYAAIHLLVAMPEFQDKVAISKYLSLPISKVSEVIEFLVSSGLVKVNGHGRFQPGTVNLFLGNDSSLISKHHANWRLQALQSLERERAEELHYSSALTIAKSDLPKLRSILVSAIEEFREVVEKSKEEGLFCVCIDLFGLGQPNE